MSLLKDERAFDECLKKMSTMQREHFKLVLSQLIECYTRDDTHGVVLIGDESPVVTVMAINATDMQAANLLRLADEHLTYRVTEDAPPKELFN